MQRLPGGLGAGLAGLPQVLGGQPAAAERPRPEFLARVGSQLPDAPAEDREPVFPREPPALPLSVTRSVPWLSTPLASRVARKTQRAAGLPGLRWVPGVKPVATKQATLAFLSGAEPQLPDAPSEGPEPVSPSKPPAPPIVAVGPVACLPKRRPEVWGAEQRRLAVLLTTRPSRVARKALGSAAVATASKRWTKRMPRGC
jgi:hypothetical protein